ncbi:TPA: hypothetical protein DCZ39_05750 [Patescibacteria group bacterium]|nr:hypothetical protein [Candidatus Gracilibacteria bacterium]
MHDLLLIKSKVSRHIIQKINTYKYGWNMVSYDFLDGYSSTDISIGSPINPMKKKRILIQNSQKK